MGNAVSKAYDVLEKVEPVFKILDVATLGYLGKTGDRYNLGPFRIGRSSLGLNLNIGPVKANVEVGKTSKGQWFIEGAANVGVGKNTMSFKGSVDTEGTITPAVNLNISGHVNVGLKAVYSFTSNAPTDFTVNTSGPIGSTVRYSALDGASAGLAGATIDTEGNTDTSGMRDFLEDSGKQKLYEKAGAAVRYRWKRYTDSSQYKNKSEQGSENKKENEEKYDDQGLIKEKQSSKKELDQSKSKSEQGSKDKKKNDEKYNDQGLTEVKQSSKKELDQSKNKLEQGSKSKRGNEDKYNDQCFTETKLSTKESNQTELRNRKPEKENNPIPTELRQLDESGNPSDFCSVCGGPCKLTKI